MKLSSKETVTLWILGVLLLTLTIAHTLVGPLSITLSEMQSGWYSWITQSNFTSLNAHVFAAIRLPRVILAILTGAALAYGGILVQSLFRNPIVEPGLIGTSGGAALGAALYFVLASKLSLPDTPFTLPILAIAGGLGATLLVYFLTQNRKGTNNVQHLLLVGLAINALMMSMVGLLSYLGRDPQARSITFWNLGTISGASWTAVTIVGFVVVIGFIIGLKNVKGMNALLLGETEAQHLGIPVNRLKWVLLFANVVVVSVATSFTGIIGFIGLITPHLLRMMGSGNHRFLLLGALFLGPILVVTADFMSQNLIPPAEIPIGVVTTIVGVPLFIYLLHKSQYFFGS